MVSDFATAPVSPDGLGEASGAAWAGRTAAQIKGDGLFSSDVCARCFFHHHEASGIRDQNGGGFDREDLDATLLQAPVPGRYIGVDKKGEPWARLRACCRALRFSSLSCSRLVASFFHDVTGIVLIAVQGIGGNQSVVQVGLLVESARNGEFSLLFVLLATGFFFGDADGYRGPAFMLAQTYRQDLVAHILAVYGQSARQGSFVTLQPPRERRGKLMGIDLAQQVVESRVTGCTA